MFPAKALSRITFLALALASFMAGGALAQTYSSTASDKHTPAGLAPGSPAGTYALGGFDTVNAYNGNLNFRLPLIQAAGRGAAGYAAMLALNTKTWRVRRSSFFLHGEETNVTWTPTTATWHGREVGYGPGVLVGRQSGVSYLECNPPLTGGQRVWRYTLTTLTFTASDGTEYELRDKETLGQPQAVSYQPACSDPLAAGFARGKVFVTTDGSAATFISDNPINDKLRASSSGRWVMTSLYGVLKLRDGMTYRVENGYVMWVRDRNGNKITFTYDSGRVSTVTDSLGRQITFAYDYQDVAPYGLCDRITFSGYGGAARVVRVSKTNLGNALRSGY
jgi:hypothetical protein